MSHMGHSRQFDLPVPLPVFPQLRTYSCIALTDAMCQQATSFDHLVGAREERRWHGEADGLRDFEVETMICVLVGINKLPNLWGD
jgi:hypothetical protein